MQGVSGTRRTKSGMTPTWASANTEQVATEARRHDAEDLRWAARRWATRIGANCGRSTCGP